MQKLFITLGLISFISSVIFTSSRIQSIASAIKYFTCLAFSSLMFYFAIAM
jgi:hypothetical protein